MKLSLSHPSAMALREFAGKIPIANENILTSAGRLSNIVSAVSDSLGIHRVDYIEMMKLICEYQKQTAEAISELPRLLNDTADRMDAYVAHSLSISQKSAAPDGAFPSGYPNVKPYIFHSQITTLSDSFSSGRFLSAGNHFKEYCAYRKIQESFTYYPYNDKRIVFVRARDIEGVNLDASEIQASDQFWTRNGNPDYSLETILNMALLVDTAKPLCDSGIPIERLCEGYHFSEALRKYLGTPVRVAAIGEYYRFENDGRHRTLASQIIDGWIPVLVTGEIVVSPKSTEAEIFEKLVSDLPKIFDKQMVLAGADERKLNAPNAVTRDGTIRGRWDGPVFCLDDNFVPRLHNKRKLTVAEIKAKLHRDYGLTLNGIPYVGGIADFSSVSLATISKKDIVMKAHKLTSEEYDSMESEEKIKLLHDVFTRNRAKDNFSIADEIAAERRLLQSFLPDGYTADDVANWRTDHEFTWDEQVQGGYLLVPTVIHSNVSHTGLVGTSKTAYKYFENSKNASPEKYCLDEDNAPISFAELYEYIELKRDRNARHASASGNTGSLKNTEKMDPF